MLTDPGYQIPPEAGPRAPSSPPALERFEFHEETVPSAGLVGWLNDMGRSGWQVVTTAPERTPLGYVKGPVYVLLTRRLP